MKVEKPNVKKSPSHILSIFFHNKGLEFIQLKSILRKPSVISKLPEKLQEDSPSIVYSLTPTIRNKIFNYKDTVESINTDDIETFGTNLPSCQCQNSPFIDFDHGHIMTGDLKFVKKIAKIDFQRSKLS